MSELQKGRIEFDDPTFMEYKEKKRMDMLRVTKPFNLSGAFDEGWDARGDETDALELARQQFTGFGVASKSGSVRELVESMALTKTELIALKDAPSRFQNEGIAPPLNFDVQFAEMTA